MSGDSGAGSGGFPSPILAVMGAGGGKTNLVRFLAAQQIRHRWPVSFVDLDDQHSWADGLPGVSRWAAIDDAESGLIGLGNELKRRARSAAGAAPSSRLLMIDGIDLLLPLLEERWNDQRQPGDPAMGPAVAAWAEIWLRGRGLGIHATVTAGRPDRGFWADVAGTRAIGAGLDRATWEAVAPGVNPPPGHDRSHPGRVYMISADGDATETQTVWITENEAREFASDAAPAE